MSKSTSGLSAQIVTTAKSSFLKAVFLSAAMLAFSSASAYASETCRTSEPTLRSLDAATLYSSPEGDYVECSGTAESPYDGQLPEGFTPPLGKLVHVSFKLYEGKGFKITPVDGTGWDSADFSDSHVSKCYAFKFDPDGKVNTCEFNVEREILSR